MKQPLYDVIATGIVCNVHIIFKYLICLINYFCTLIFVDYGKSGRYSNELLCR